MVKAGEMKPSNRSPRRHPTKIGAARRTRLLVAFDRSGLSAAAFARQHRLNYTTFCGWRQRRANAKPAPAFVQVELPEPAAPVELMIELGAQSRMPITSTGQIELAVRLLQALNARSAC